MKVLILDHHFKQDIDSLLLANHVNHEVRTVSPYYFANHALKCFPPPVWGPDFSAYYAPELEQARAEYREVAFQLLFDLYKIFPFDLFVSPSDTFFYVRDVIDACHEIGVPFVVLQKETGVAANSLRDEAEATRRWYPFKGDWMTTSSMRSREFWLASGARLDQISVVGQPRYDFYQQPERWIPLERLGVTLPPGKTRVLFLSFNFDAYDEKRGITTHRPWEALHRQIETALVNLGASGRCEILFKPHPQQDLDCVREIRARIEGSAGITFVDSVADTRQFIVAADVVVGFQTTGLAEAMAAGRRVIYTFWTDRVLAARDLLLPFDTMTDCIDVARSPEELERLVLDEADHHLGPEAIARRLELADPYLGPVDGRASERVWRILEEQAALWSQPSSDVLARRAALRAEAPDYCRRELRRAQRRLAVRQIFAIVGIPARSIRQGAITRRLAEKCDQESARVAECRAAITGQVPPARSLVGRIEEGLVLPGLAYIKRQILDRSEQTT